MKMALPYLILFAVLSCATGHPTHPRAQSKNKCLGYPFPFVTRERWGASPPTGAVSSLNTPVPYVVIHHTYVPGICTTRLNCSRDMRAMQNYHQHGNGWFDIGYNFAVGGEGSVYEGRGWDTVGAHAAGTNSKSIGIAIIGDFRSSPPPAIALHTAKQLIGEGVRRGHISADYKLVGHRQVGITECPGDALFREIETWEHFAGTTDPEHENDKASAAYSFSYVPRAIWGANSARSVTRLNTPVSHVVIHHTVVPGLCMTREQCIKDMKSMQNTHQNTNGWADIGYNFAVGGDGSVYEGRGWETVGAHSSGFNSRSIGIAIIGNYVSQLPPAAALESAKRLIAVGVQLGHIRADYRVVGHRQVTTTECPGSALFREIQTWNRYSHVL